jgi:copper chaperone CopZ
MREETYFIKGMSCTSCARSIENSLRGLPQVAEADVDFNQSKLVLSFKEEGLSLGSIQSEIQKLGGYELSPYEEQNTVPSQRNYSPFLWGVLGAVGISIVFYLVQTLGMLDFRAPLDFTRDKWYFIFPLILGFGVQMGFFRAIHLKTKQGIAIPAASGGVTTTAMIACCMHNLVTLFPFLGLSGLAVLFGVYQDYIFGLSLVFVAGGILFMGWKYSKVHACCKK